MGHLYALSRQLRQVEVHDDGVRECIGRYGEVKNGMIVGICLLLIAGIFTGDLWLKNYIEKNMGQNEVREMLGGRLLLSKHHNRGVVLNVGERKRSVVAALSVALTTVAVLAFVFSLGRKGNNLLRIGLALLLGGAFSNTYDRLKRKYVVDYASINVKCKGIRSIIFNVSDLGILIGALLSALGAWR